MTKTKRGLRGFVKDGYYNAFEAPSILCPLPNATDHANDVAMHSSGEDVD